MKEFREIIKAYDGAVLAGKKSVLATIVHLEGSSYRRPGARMLVLEDGSMIGAISGGCLEGDARIKALLTLTEKKSRVVVYDTGDEDDASVGVQLGCEGVIQVLFEYIDPEDPCNPIELLRRALSSRTPVILVSLYDLSNKWAAQIGSCQLYDTNGNATGSNPFSEMDAFLKENTAQVFSSKQSKFLVYQTDTVSTQVFVEYVTVPVSLVIVGAGNDAIPVMQMAEILGWEVRVVDGRNTHAKPDRFISACQILVSKPEAVLKQLVIDDRTCFVLMTHNYNYDLQMLKARLSTKVNYIGVLGPRKKLIKMLDQLKNEGMSIDEEMLARIYGPTGLDIGAETPEEIAVSILAEIQAVFNERNGTMLKWKNKAIH